MGGSAANSGTAENPTDYPVAPPCETLGEALGVVLDACWGVRPHPGGYAPYCVVCNGNGCWVNPGNALDASSISHSPECRERMARLRDLQQALLAQG